MLRIQRAANIFLCTIRYERKRSAVKKNDDSIFSDSAKDIRSTPQKYFLKNLKTNGISPHWTRVLVFMREIPSPLPFFRLQVWGEKMCDSTNIFRQLGSDRTNRMHSYKSSFFQNFKFPYYALHTRLSTTFPARRGHRRALTFGDGSKKSGARDGAKGFGAKGFGAVVLLPMRSWACATKFGNDGGTACHGRVESTW